MAETIIPRWEWRTFAKQIGTKMDLAAYPRTRHVVSSEIYLVSETSEDNPKVRDKKMDIKQLQRIDDEGLEQWKPVMKADFPLSVDQVREVFRTLGLGVPRYDGGPIALEAFLALIGEDRRARAVRVDKVRDLFDVDGCIVEAADVSFDGDVYRTLAVEDPDPKKLMDTVDKLGLSGRENLNYVKAIKKFAAER
jgi:exopolyphosphatase/guanosine-5'-triphosphate,3'-diphosphate pyrophosphatase